MTLDTAKVKAFTVSMGIDDAIVDLYAEVVASQIEEFIGKRTVSKWVTIPSQVNFAAAKLIKMWQEQNEREEGISSESMSSSTLTFTLGESGLPREVEAILKPLRRVESFVL